MEAPRRGRSRPGVQLDVEMVAPYVGLEPAAAPDKSKKRGSREFGNLVRGGYGGRADVDPGVAWRSLEPSKGPNKTKAGHERTGHDPEDVPVESKQPRTRSGRVSLPPRSPTPPTTPTPPTPPHALPPLPESVAGASLCCGSRIIDVGLLQDLYVK